MRVLLIAIAILAGCASDPEVRYVSRPVRVEVPVVIPCTVTPPMPENYVTPAAGDTPFEKVRKLLVERRQRMQVEEELRSLLSVCTRPLNGNSG